MSTGQHTSSPFLGRGLLARLGAGRERWRRKVRKATERAAFQDLFALAPIPIVMLHGEDLVLDLANDAALEVIGREDVIGKALLEVLPELEGQGCARALREVMTTGIAFVRKEAFVGLEGPNAAAYGTTYWTYTCARMRRETGREPKVIVVLADATPQVHARRSLEALAAKADAANRAKDQFVAMLGHELRNPLSPIVTALELLRLRGLDTAEQALIERQVAHVVRLVDDLLDVSRIARGKVELKKQTMEIAQIVYAAVEMVGPLLEDREHLLSIDVPLGLRVDVDPDRMSQVVSNLLTNAARYSERRSPISIAAEMRGDRVRLSVTDEGIGIEPERFEEVFDAFAQHEQTSERSHGGLGLGLAIVRNFVGLHDGEVRAFSGGVGKGSRFTILLPWVPAADGGATKVPAAAPRPNARGARILVIDDNRDAAEAMASALAMTGYDVRVAYDGPSALCIARDFVPETALVDIGLPVMDGYELGGRLMEQSAALRLVAVTGYGQAEDHERSAASGFEAHLVKPVSLDDVRAVLEPAPRYGRRALRRRESTPTGPDLPERKRKPSAP